MQQVEELKKIIFKFYVASATIPRDITDFEDLIYPYIP